MTDNNAVSHWIERVKAGDSAAANQIWHHYFDRLVRAVRRRLQGQDRAVSDEEDVRVLTQIAESLTMNSVNAAR